MYSMDKDLIIVVLGSASELCTYSLVEVREVGLPPLASYVPVYFLNPSQFLVHMGGHAKVWDIAFAQLLYLLFPSLFLYNAYECLLTAEKCAGLFLILVNKERVLLINFHSSLD